MLAAVIVATTLAAVLVVPRLRPAPPVPTTLRPTTSRPAAVALRRALRHPGTWLAAVVALFAVNQVLVTAFVHQRWGDDPSRITRYLPPGWFDLADLGPLADRLPAWPWTVLHAQAALELPFVVLAYLLVCRWWSADVAARVIGARWLLVASWTAVFCLVELDLRNPYTTVDVVIRLVSAVVTALALPALDGGKRRAVGLVTAVVSAAALGCLVLCVYDVATLYNSAHLVRWLPVVAVASVALAAARWTAAHRRAHVPGPVTAAAVASLGWFLVLFAVPALPLRYGIGFGAAPVTAAAGLVVVLASLRRGWDRSVLGGLVVAVLGGGAVAASGFLLAHGYPEARMLAAATGFVLGAAATTVLLDRRRPERRG